MRVIITTTVDGEEIARQVTRDQDVQGVVSQVIYQATMLNRDPSNAAPETFPEIVITVKEAPAKGKKD